MRRHKHNSFLRQAQTIKSQGMFKLWDVPTASLLYTPQQLARAQYQTPGGKWLFCQPQCWCASATVRRGDYENRKNNKGGTLMPV